jgi:hypothetical protein
MEVGLVVLLCALPAAAQQIHIDYDRWARFTTFKTVAWADTDETSVLVSSPLMHERIKSAIMAQFTAGRLSEDTENPDLYVTYHTNEREALRIDTHYWGYGYPSSWYWDPYWGPVGTTTVRSYTQGTFVIDVWNAEEETLVWRGVAIGTVSQNPEKNAKKIEKAIKKMYKRWQKMKPGF